jgi:hypothetical protein
VQDISPEALTDAGHVRQLVSQARCDEHPPCAHLGAVGDPGDEAAALADDIGDVTAADGASVTFDLGAAGREELAGRQAVPRQEAVHVGCWRVARLSAVDHEDPSPGSGEE